MSPAGRPPYPSRGRRAAWPRRQPSSYPTTLAIAGSTAVVVDPYADQISLFNTRTQHVFAPVTVGHYPVAVAISS